MAMLNLIPPPDSKPPVTVTEGPRLLTEEEIRSIAYLFNERGVSMPNGAYLGYVKEGRVVGFMVAQNIIHVEPVWLDKGQSGLFLPLVNAMRNHLLNTVGPTYVYLLAPEGRISSLAESVGMNEEPYKVYSKVIQFEVPKPVMDIPQPEDHSEILEREVDHVLRTIEHAEAGE